MAWRHPDRIFTPGPAVSPFAVSLAEIKAQLKIGFADDDTELTSYIAAAQGKVEAVTKRLLTARPCVLSLPALPSGSIPLELPGGPVSAVASVMADGTPIVGTTIIGDGPAQLVPAADWPVVVGTGFPVMVTYTAGYLGNACPAALKVATLLIAADFYERRSIGSDQVSPSLPVSAAALMADYRIWSVG